MSEDIVTPEFKTYAPCEVAKMTGFSQTLIYDAIRSGELRSMRPHGTMRGARITAEAIHDWMHELENSK